MRKMRVGLLMHGADRPVTGVTRVAVELGRALQQRDDCEVVFLVPYRSGPFRGAGYESAYLPGCGRVAPLMLFGGPVTSVAARRLKLDLIHDPVGASPFTLGRWAGRYKRVVSIHDAIAFRYPEGYPRLNNFLHRRYVPFTLRNVDAVVTVSDHARADLAEFLDIPPPDVFVAPLGVSELFRPVEDAESERVVSQLGLDRPFILSVGVKEARKNLARLIMAFEDLHPDLPEYQLALVGPTLWRHPISIEAIKARGIRDRVRLIEYVSDEELRALYSRASLFVHPSLYEGFGLPVLEAMACGTPVVASNSTSIPEVAGDAAVLVDPTDVPAIAQAMRRVLTDTELRSSLRARGFERARQFTWKRAAERTAAVYRSVLSSDSRGAEHARDRVRRPGAVTEGRSERAEDRVELTVCVPTFDRPQLLERAIGSAVGSGAGYEDLVEILVADNSPDFSRDASDRALGRWSGRSVYLPNESNIGAVANFNQCIQRASGRFVFFLHDDDVLRPNAIGDILDVVRHPNPSPVLLFGAHVVDERGRLMRRQEFATALDLAPDAALRRVLSDIEFVRFPAIVVRRDVYLEVGPFQERFANATDLDMWVRLFSRYGVRCVPPTISVYSAGGDTATQRMTYDRHAVETLSEIFDVARATNILPGRTVDTCQREFFHQFILGATWLRLRVGDAEGARPVMALFRLPAVRRLGWSVRWLPIRLIFEALVRAPAGFVRPLVTWVSRHDVVRRLRARRKTTA